MLAAPATVGVRKFWSNLMNWIDLLAIMPIPHAEGGLLVAPQLGSPTSCGRVSRLLPCARSAEQASAAQAPAATLPHPVAAHGATLRLCPSRRHVVLPPCPPRRPFYLELLMLAVVSGEGGADLGPFAVLRVIRLTRVVRVLKVRAHAAVATPLATPLATSPIAPLPPPHHPSLQARLTAPLPHPLLHPSHDTPHATLFPR